MPMTPSLSHSLHVLLQQAIDAEAHQLSQAAMLDLTFDLHNDLTQWAVNTEHNDAALEVMAILEQYVLAGVEPVHRPLIRSSNTTNEETWD